MEYAAFDDDVQIFSFRLGLPFFGKFGPKRQNCLIKMKLGAYTDSNMLNLMVMFNCHVLDQEYPFGVNIVQTIKIVIKLFKMKFGT